RGRDSLKALPEKNERFRRLLRRREAEKGDTVAAEAEMVVAVVVIFLPHAHFPPIGIPRFLFFFIYCSALFGCILLSFTSPIEAFPRRALITKIPGFSGTFPSKHYSGYITINGAKTVKAKHLYYYFVESERKPSIDPLVLWLNGGPGCSSFDGFVYEHGPFNFKPGKKNGSLPLLQLNPYSWSKVSNIIYLDSPAGVGFSYSYNETTYKTGDYQTALDTHAFLLKWLKQYRKFAQNPFYIAGESFGGIYVPTLANEVVKGIKAKVTPNINFKGYMIGNGVVGDSKYDTDSIVSFAHGMGLISDDLYNKMLSTCGVNLDQDTPECDNSTDEFNMKIKGLNMYDILEPCYHKPGDLFNSRLPESFQQLGQTKRPLPVRTRMFGRAWPFQTAVNDGLVLSWPELFQDAVNRRVDVPCTSDEIASAWLNDASVRKAIHAKSRNTIGTWSLCMKIEYYHDAGSMIVYHKRLTSQGYRALIYSGDHDMCVPFTGTEEWTKSLGYKVVDTWRPWIVNGQIAGYLQGYQNNLTFLTIKGAGHTVPEYKPQEALEFYSRWLEGKSI
ncbi:hypothetical protein V2J09_023653, partial [Rumex salicifolius]